MAQKRTRDLTEDIGLTAGYEAVNASGKRKNNNQILNRKSPNLLPALIAVGGACGLAALPVNALELGDIQINSALGEPLRASIAYALNPNEQIYDYCIYLRAGVPGSSMSTMSDARIAITENSILLTGRTPIREPMLGMQVAADCAYTPHLSREYILMFDPRAPIATTRSFVADNSVVETPQQAQPVKPAAREITSADTAVTRPTTGPAFVDQSPIAMNTRYRVQRGDTISTIVARVEDRSLGLWPAVDIVFAANPDAFIDQDINRIMAGSEIIIPNFTANLTADSDVEDTVVDFTAASEAQSGATVAASTEDINSITEESRESPSVVEAPVVVEAADAIVTTDGNDSVSELRPGDVIMSPIDSETTEFVAPDTAIDSQTADVPVISSANPNNAGTSDSWSWLLWLGGTGVALILGLLLFGRNLRERFGSSEASAAEAPARRRDDDPTQKSRVVKEVDFELEDTINAQAISLDADLEAGTGLNSEPSLDVAEDFGFSAGDQIESELDMEITEDAAQEQEANSTDIIQPHHREEVSSIIVEEQPPTNGDEDYDLSMIVDATKQPIGDYDATAKDLQAVQIDAVHNDADDSSYTVSTAVDYDTLEQDYQDELTATQVLNAEMQKAAVELANRMEEDESIDVTTEMPSAESATPDGASADPTAEMPGPDVTRDLPVTTKQDVKYDDLPVVSDSDITAELTANLPTSIEAENDSVANDLSEITVEMTAAGSDITVDMQAHSDTDDSRKK